MIEVKNASYVYSAGGPFEKEALSGVDLRIESGEFCGLIGHTGSGKSTLVQLIAGLIRPTNGQILIDGIDIGKKGARGGELKGRVGLVFQYPEHQLFEETVIKDVCFGPLNLGFSPEEARSRASAALQTVGIPEALYEKSPFDISGGQKRRVAVSGVLAMEPSVLILDEPTAGLDPAGREDILNSIKELHRTKKITVILVSHSMEDIARSASRIIVMNNGKVAEDGDVNYVFSRHEKLSAMGLSIPQIGRLMLRLGEMGLDVPKDIYTVSGAAEYLTELIGGKNA